MIDQEVVGGAVRGLVTLSLNFIEWDQEVCQTVDRRTTACSQESTRMTREHPPSRAIRDVVPAPSLANFWHDRADTGDLGSDRVADLVWLRGTLLLRVVAGAIFFRCHVTPSQGLNDGFSMTSRREDHTTCSPFSPSGPHAFRRVSSPTLLSRYRGDMARPPRWQSTLDASMSEACLAVRLYNDPAEARSFQGYVVHMHLAWLYLLQAAFVRDGIDFRYWDQKRKKRLVRIDGDPKRWELERSVQERWTDPNDPVPANLRLFIRLRNRLEHRHANADAALTLALAGHSHALLVNYEQEVTAQFGQNNTLASRLRLPLFVGSFSAQGERALRDLRDSLPADLQAFIAEFESGLDDAVTNDARFEFRLRATLELSAKDPGAVAFQFTRYEDLSEDERRAVESLGRKGRVVVRSRIQPVSGTGRLMARSAAAAVQERIPFEFKQHHFTAAWQRLKARPVNSAPNPYLTNPDWCEYDEPTGTYRYTLGFVKHVARRCGTPEGFRAVTGFRAVELDPQSSGDSDAK